MSVQMNTMFFTMCLLNVKLRCQRLSDESIDSSTSGLQTSLLWCRLSYQPVFIVYLCKCLLHSCRALRADRRNESKGSKVRVPGSMFSECRDVRTHQHSAQGRWVQALSDLALSFVTVLLRRHLHVPHRHSNSGFSLPRVSVRATALKMLNNVDLLVESVNGADAVR